jgi:hypothetical protein
VDPKARPLAVEVGVAPLAQLLRLVLLSGLLSLVTSQPGNAESPPNVGGPGHLFCVPSSAPRPPARGVGHASSGAPGTIARR